MSHHSTNQIVRIWICEFTEMVKLSTGCSGTSGLLFRNPCIGSNWVTAGASLGQAINSRRDRLHWLTARSCRGGKHCWPALLERRARMEQYEFLAQSLLIQSPPSALCTNRWMVPAWRQLNALTVTMDLVAHSLHQN